MRLEWYFAQELNTLLESSRQISKRLFFSEAIAVRYFNIRKAKKLFFRKYKDLK